MSVVGEIYAERRRERAEERRDRWQRADQRRQRRAAALRAGARWLGGHPVELLMSVVVVVPGLLAWTAMAAFGHDLYGPLGLLFPAFSEAASWAFAFAASQARRADPPRPVAALCAGLWVFAGVQAVLNALHGAQISTTAAVVMPIVSVSGVAVHQIHMFSHRSLRTVEQRRADRRRRLADQRTHRMATAAIRQAYGEVYGGGHVELNVASGVVRLRRNRLLPWRHQIDYVGPTASGSLGEQVEQWLSTGTTGESNPAAHPPVEPAGAESIEPAATGESTHPDLGDDQHESSPTPTPIRQPDRRSFDELRAEFWDAIATDAPLDRGRPIEPSSAESIRRGLRCGARPARELRTEWQHHRGNGPAAAAAA